MAMEARSTLRVIESWTAGSGSATTRAPFSDTTPSPAAMATLRSASSMLVTATGTTRQTCSARTSAASGNVRTPPSISPTSSTSGALWNICGNCVTLARSCRSIRFRSRERMRRTVRDVITPFRSKAARDRVKAEVAVSAIAASLGKASI